jgi:hypothetical protein
VPTWLIIVLVALAVLAVGGFFARRMWLRRTEGQFRAQLEQANHDLAEAAAADRGWDRATLETAARRFYADQRGHEPAELLPDEDLAVFQVEGEGHRQTIRLGRRDGDWMLEDLA